MTKQNTVTLNLTVQEAECIKTLVSNYADNYIFGVSSGRPCKPFVDKLNKKIISATQKIKP